MSNLAVLAVILSTLIGTAFFVLYATSRTDTYSDTIVTGFYEGVRMSLEHRWYWLYNQWLPVIAVTIVVTFLIAIGLLQVANHTNDDDIVWLARLSASLVGLGCLMSVGILVSGFLYLSSVLRAVPQEDG